MCGAGEVGRAESNRLAAAGRGLVGVVVVVMVVGRGHPDGGPSQLLQLRQPFGKSQGAGFDLVQLLTVAWKGTKGALSLAFKPPLVEICAQLSC